MYSHVGWRKGGARGRDFTDITATQEETNEESEHKCVCDLYSAATNTYRYIHGGV